MRKWPLHKGFDLPQFNLQWHIPCHSRISIITMCVWITLLSHWANVWILNSVYPKDHIKLHLFTLFLRDNATYSRVWRRLWESIPELPVQQIFWLRTQPQTRHKPGVRVLWKVLESGSKKSFWSFWKSKVSALDSTGKS